MPSTGDNRNFLPETGKFPNSFNFQILLISKFFYYYNVLSQVKVIDFRLTQFKLVITLAHVSQMGRRDLYIYGKGFRVRNVVHVPVTTAIDCAVAQLALRIHLSTTPIVVIEC